MTVPRCRLLLASTATTCALVLGSAAAPALTPAAPVKINSTGVGGVKLGKRYKTLRAAGLVGPIGAGCELAGPQARAAGLSPPLKGSVDFTTTNIRRVSTILVRGGATARGVGVGSSRSAVRTAFPRAVFDHSTDKTFGLTIVKVPRGGGGRLQFAVDTKTRKVTLIGIPHIPFCE